MTAAPTLREHARAIALAGVAAVDPAVAVLRSLSMQGDRLQVGDLPAITLDAHGTIHLVGAGKAAAAMTRAAVERLEGRIVAGCITVTSDTPVAALEGLPATIDIWRGGHPLPTMEGLAGAGEALALARSAGPADLVLCLLSGGASSLWAAPAPGLSLSDLQRAGSALLRSGAPIEAVNTVRRHLSAIGGGRLAHAAAPATVVTLAISDVIATGPEAIGSGPTLPDPSTYAHALDVVRRYAVDLPAASLRHLQAGAAGMVPETPKPGDLPRVAGLAVILSIEDAIRSAASEATRLGYRPRVMDTSLQGEARDAGARIATDARRARDELDEPTALIWGGETTVTVRGGGVGGRNQELALAAAFGIDGEAGITILSLGTDGRDGPTEAAGGLVDGGTLARGRAAGSDPSAALYANDSHPFLQATGDLLITGPTGTNVNDLVIALVIPPEPAG